MTSIFSDENKRPTKVPFWKYEKIGEKLEGTLVGKGVRLNQLSDKDQIVYEIKQTNGEYINVGGKYGIDVQMRGVKLGQVLGFEFVELRKQKNPAMSDAKIIQVYADPDIVDKEWIQQHEEEVAADASSNNNSEKEDIQDIDEVDVDEIIDGKKTDDKDAMLEKIAKLAKSKLGADDAKEVKEKVMEATELAFIDSNLEKIIDVLLELPDTKK